MTEPGFSLLCLICVICSVILQLLPVKMDSGVVFYLV